MSDHSARVWRRKIVQMSDHSALRAMRQQAGRNLVVTGRQVCFCGRFSFGSRVAETRSKVHCAYLRTS
jgi:hypothetical protein